MGRCVRSKKIGKNYMVKMYYFREGYKIYAYRRTTKGNWWESIASAYPHSKKDADAEFKEYKTARDILLLHPALRSKITKDF